MLLLFSYLVSPKLVAANLAASPNPVAVSPEWTLFPHRRLPSPRPRPCSATAGRGRRHHPALRPSVLASGKTSLLFQFAVNRAAESGRGVVFICSKGRMENNPFLVPGC